MPSKLGFEARQALARDLGKVPGHGQASAFPSMKREWWKPVLPRPTSWNYFEAFFFFLLSAWQKVGAQLTEAIGTLVINK